ncbi:RDD family protein [Flavobacterium oreochromis]|uniref:Uncharacterized protein n=1 Tax=Flavobacterium columnare TaxID=996 RepID=A0A246G7D6_9FLAO|nr:hypothetical protein [Flavobacterium oreochromis]OWP74347.1 hypothetical protein BWK62_14575 [Flavobacterium oreochromis]
MEKLVNNNLHIEKYNPTDTYIYSFIFFILSSSLFILNSINKINSRFIYMNFIMMFIFFMFNFIVITYTKPFSIGENVVVDSVVIGYKILFFLPTLYVSLFLLKNIVVTLKIDIFFNSYQFYYKSSLDIRIKRLIARVIDLIIMYSMSIIFFTNPIVGVILTYFAYNFLFELTFKTTIGKKIFGLTIEDKSENSFVYSIKVFLRTVMRFIPLYGCTVLFNKRGVHEYFSNVNTVTIALINKKRVE